MKKMAILIVLGVLVLGALPSSADLQNVTVGGSLRIRGNFFYEGDQFGEHVNSRHFIEERARLNVKADFTENVSAFIEFDNYDVWGGDFRSNYLTGVDSRANTSDDAEVYQAYIDAKELWGTDLSARIGRQEMKFGNGWLVGPNDQHAYFYGLSFDALRLTYATDQFKVDAFASKLAENSPLQEDGDIDFYGVYGSYLGVENMNFDAYWFMLRDAQNFSGSQDTHTFGLRGAGKINAFDFEADGAYQLVDRDNLDNSDAWGGNLEVGYTFDMATTPRLYIGTAYYEGAEDGDLAFNRLFASKRYGLVLDNMSCLSNMWVVRGGLIVNATESLKIMSTVGYVQADQSRKINATDESRKALGLEADIRAEYAYTKDLTFGCGYAHVFMFDGIKDGNYLGDNGTVIAQLSDDMDYLFFETKIAF